MGMNVWDHCEVNINTNQSNVEWMPLTLYYYFECERECACSNIQARVLSQIENFHYHISCTFPTTKDY